MQITITRVPALHVTLIACIIDVNDAYRALPSRSLEIPLGVSSHVTRSENQSRYSYNPGWVLALSAFIVSECLLPCLFYLFLKWFTNTARWTRRVTKVSNNGQRTANRTWQGDRRYVWYFGNHVGCKKRQSCREQLRESVVSVRAVAVMLRCTMAQIAFKMPINSTKGANKLIRPLLGLFRAQISNLCLFYIWGQCVTSKMTIVSKNVGM